MTDPRTMVRAQITMGDQTFSLAQGQNLEDLKRSFEEARRAGGRFVDFVVVGNRRVGTLLAEETPVELSVQTVPYDPRDTGDEAFPFGGRFD